MNSRDFEIRYLGGFNESQREAVKSVYGPVLLLAVPGSGKTTVLVNRLGYMTCVENIPPESILTMTYTIAATREMKERFTSLFGPAIAKFMEFRTINALSQMIIDYYGRTAAKASPFTIENNDGVISRIIKSAYFDVLNEYPDDSDVRDIKTAITYVKNMMFTADETASYEGPCDRFSEIFARYNSALREMKKMDFDDQCQYSLLVLKKHPEILEYFRNKYRFICVDEAQDTSRLQHTIIRMLAGESPNIFMVGDEDQSIYGFRAAYPEALLHFAEDYPGAKVLYLNSNYRSVPEIIELSNRFVAKNKNRYDKRASAVRNEHGKAEKIIFSKRQAQYSYAFDIARQASAETAFLYRNNDSALPLIDMLERNSIPFNCRKFDEVFFSNRVIQDIRDIAAFSDNQKDSALFMKLYYKLLKGLSKQSAMAACEYAAEKGIPVLGAISFIHGIKPDIKNNAASLSMQFRSLKKDRAETAVTRIFTAMNYGAYIKKQKSEDAKYETLLMLAKNVPDLNGLIIRLDELRAIINEHENSPDALVTLSTVHSAKGLEFETVYLLDVYDTVLPALPYSMLETETGKAQYQEERRIMYVAMTRAKNELYICAFNKPSEFIDELFPVVPRKLKDIL